MKSSLGERLSHKMAEFQELSSSFIYDSDLHNGVSIVKRGPIILGNDAVFIDEWSVLDGLRHGRGKQMWPDGSVYEGYLANDKTKAKVD
jgi:hypothetical protein